MTINRAQAVIWGELMKLEQCPSAMTYTANTERIAQMANITWAEMAPLVDQMKAPDTLEALATLASVGTERVLAGSVDDLWRNYYDTSNYRSTL